MPHIRFQQGGLSDGAHFAEVTSSLMDFFQPQLSKAY